MNTASFAGQVHSRPVHWDGPGYCRPKRALIQLGQTLNARRTLVSALTAAQAIGLAIWERRGGSGRNVTFPARSYAVNGERRSFALLRPIVDQTAQNRVRELVLEAYAEYEEQSAIAS